MKFLILVLTFVVGAFAVNVQDFEQFKKLFNKRYDSVEDEVRSWLNFERSLQWIKQNQNKLGHDIGITSLADTDDSYFPNILVNSTSFVTTTHEQQKDGAVKIPESYDWREHIHMHEPEAQGRCGSCWAFVSATIMEARIAITQKVNVHISRQELLDCTKKVVKTNNGCHGGHAYDGWEYAIRDGVHDDTIYPYHQQQGVCHSDIHGKKYYLKSVHKLAHRTTDQDLMASLLQYGPLNVNIFANHNEFKFYKGGIMKNLYPNATNHNHAVVLVGWGFDHKDNLAFWIVRNSWGTHWGEMGYARVQRGINSMGMNDYVSFPQ